MQDHEGFAHIWRNAQRSRNEFLAAWFSQIFNRLSKADTPNSDLALLSLSRPGKQAEKELTRWAASRRVVRSSSGYGEAPEAGSDQLDVGKGARHHCASRAARARRRGDRSRFALLRSVRPGQHTCEISNQNSTSSSSSSSGSVLAAAIHSAMCGRATMAAQYSAHRESSLTS
jgi:hypothetical protein